MSHIGVFFFFLQAEDGIRYLVRSRGLGDVYKRQPLRTQQLDFVHQPHHLDIVIDHIEATLAGREELILD